MTSQQTAVISTPALRNRRSSNDPPGKTAVDSFYSLLAKQSVCQPDAVPEINELNESSRVTCTTVVQKEDVCIINAQ
jgi:hypothetical protein